jgi:hypothetical protein
MHRYLHALPRYLVVVLIGFGAVSVPVLAQESGQPSFDNLQQLTDSEMAVAYIDPEADFSVFTKVAILEPYVAFRSNWQRDQNRARRGGNVSARDMENIRAGVSNLLRDVFVEALEANDGYEVVDDVGYDVLLVRPAIIDLDVAAPDVASAGRNQEFTTTAGSATLYIELFDSASGKIIGRAADRRAAQRPGGIMMRANRVTNVSDARRMFRVWADRLREFLDSHYTGK